MQQLFNLQTYLLNEGLNSNILSQKILNEPSGFFKAFYVPSVNRMGYDSNKSHSVYLDVYSINQKCIKCIEKLFNANFLRHYTFKNIDINSVIDMYNDTIKSSSKEGMFYKLSDDKLIEINKKYNQLIAILLRKCKNLGKRANGKILSEIMLLSKDYDNKRCKWTDILNLTDSHFKTFTFRELKTMDSLPDGDMYFWFRKSDNYLLAISDNTYILADNPLIGSTFYYHHYDDTKDYSDKLIKLTLKTKLSSGDILIWPLTSYFGYTYRKNDTIENILQYKRLSDNIPSIYNKVKKIGNPKSSVSNIRKGIGWGTDLDDYVIVLTYPRSLVSSDDRNVSYVTDKDFNSNRINAYKKGVRDNYIGSATYGQYKWKNNDLLLMLPYRVNYKNSKYGNARLRVVVKDPDTGKLVVRMIDYRYLSDENLTIYYCNNTDEYSEVCIKNNLERYKSLACVVKYKKELLSILRVIKELQAIISECMSEIDNLIRRYKEVRKTLTLDEIRIINNLLLISESSDTNYSIANMMNGIITDHTTIELDYDELVSKITKLLKNIENSEIDNSLYVSNVESMYKKIQSSYINPNIIDRINLIIEETIKPLLYKE